MRTLTRDLPIEHDAPIPTWFGVGGRAERLARPRTMDELRACLDLDAEPLILGDGANLLVDDEGVDALVISLAAMDQARFDAAGGRLAAGAGARLPRLIVEAARLGLAGIETLAGIPATLGGAIRMNAGGRFGEISSVVERVRGVRIHDRAEIELDPSCIAFAYRESGLDGVIITGADLRLSPDDPALVRDRLKEVMAFKKQSQPMGERSAGCCFRNPTLQADIPGIGRRGERASAGLLIDRAGGKGLRIGGAAVSSHHANFLTAEPGARARDVTRLMDHIAALVHERFGVTLRREVVVWSRRP